MSTELTAEISDHASAGFSLSLLPSWLSISGDAIDLAEDRVPVDIQTQANYSWTNIDQLLGTLTYYVSTIRHCVFM